MKMQNSFKELYEEDAKEFREKHDASVKKRVKSSISIYKLVGEVAEIYLSRVVDVILLALSDKKK